MVSSSSDGRSQHQDSFKRVWWQFCGRTVIKPAWSCPDVESFNLPPPASLTVVSRID